MQKNEYLYPNISLDEIGTIHLPIIPWDRIFLHGDLWAGKTTFVAHWIRVHLSDPDLPVQSPTYVYYRKYGANIYHFDLYRMDDEEVFASIGWEEILDNPNNICFIEWSERLDGMYESTKSVFIEKTENPDVRNVRVLL